MKKTLKRALAFLLVLAMSVSMLNVPVYAQGTMEKQRTTELLEESASDTLAEDISTSVEKISGNESELLATELRSNDWDGVTTQQIYEGENYKATFILDGYWNGGYLAKIKIQNISKKIGI